MKKPTNGKKLKEKAIRKKGKLNCLIGKDWTQFRACERQAV